MTPTLACAEKRKSDIGSMRLYSAARGVVNYVFNSADAVGMPYSIFNKNKGSSAAVPIQCKFPMERRSLEDNLRHPVLAEFYAYWRSLAGPGRLPARQDIDPQAIPRLLPFLFMIDVSGTAPDTCFTYRLAGTEIVRTYGIEFTGMTPEEAFPDRAEELIAQYREVVNTGEPAYHAYKAPLAGREHLDVERLVCPLGTGGDQVDILIGVLGFRT